MNIAARIKGMVPVQLKRSAKKVIESGKRHYFRNYGAVVKWVSASSCLGEMLIRYSGAAPVSFYVELSRIYRSQGKYDLAERTIEHGLTKYNKESKLAVAFAEIAMHRRDWNAAIERWRSLHESHGDRVKSQSVVQLSKALFETGAFIEAQTQLISLLTKEPNHAGALWEIKRQVYRRARHYWVALRFWPEKDPGNIVNADHAGRDRLLLATSLEEASLHCTRVLDSVYGKKRNTAICEFTLVKLLLSDVRGADHDYESACIAVREALSVLIGESAPELGDVVLSAVKSVRRGNYTFDQKKIVLGTIDAVDARQLTCACWLGVYDILLWHGLFECGYAARQKAEEQAYNESENNPGNTDVVANAFRAAVGGADFEKAGQYEKRLEILGEKKINAASMSAYHHLSRGDCKGFEKRRPNRSNRVDKLFSQYIKNKSIAVVGPAPTGEKNGEEIDAFDIVVRFSYTGSHCQCDTREFGTKTNISYYGSLFLKKFIGQIGKQISTLDFIVYKNIPSAQALSCFHDVPAKPIIPVGGFFYKKPTTMPAALYDLLHYDPGHIKLFHTNFYLSEKIYADHHAGRKANCQVFADKLNTIHSVMYTHDHLCQLQFVRNLWNAKIIEADRSCEKVLSMSDKDYMIAMEAMNAGGAGDPGVYK